MQIRHYHEIRPRGTAQFPMELYHITDAHPRYRMDLHWHAELELIRVVSGTLLLSIDGIEYQAKENDVFWLSGGMLHTATPNDCVYECLVFEPSLLLKHEMDGISFFPNDDLPQIFPIPKLDTKNPVIIQAIGTLFDTMKTKPMGYSFLVYGALLSLLGTVLATEQYQYTSTIHTKTRHNLKRIKQVLSYIELHYSEQMSLADLSKIAGMTPKYFCRYFREMTGRTPIDFVNYYRIEQAAYLLKTTDQSVTEVAFACGYNDLSYFIRTFKRYQNHSPSKHLLLLES